MDRKLPHCKGKFLKRDSRGRARWVCGYVAHNQVSSDLTYTLLKISSSKKFAKNIITDMRQSGALGKSSNILCTTCYDHFTGKNFSSNSEENDSEDVQYSTETDHDTSEGSDSNDVEGEKVRVGSSDDGGTLEFGEAEHVNALMTDLIRLLQKLDCVSKNLVNHETLSILLNTIASLFIQKEIYDDGMDMKLWYKDIGYLE